MALADNPIIQRAAVIRALKAEGYSPERIAETLAAMDRPDLDEDAEAEETQRYRETAEWDRHRRSFAPSRATHL